MPQEHYKTTTATAALRADGLCALDLVDRAANGGRFRAYVTGILAPVLRPGDPVILDNLGANKVAGVLEAAGARLLFLPPYSPAFNPIKRVFSNLKRLLGTRAARTASDLWAAIGQALTRFTAHECRNCLSAAGCGRGPDRAPVPWSGRQTACPSA